MINKSIALIIRNMYLLIVMVLLASTTLAQSKPNVIFILADDLGWGDLSCYGGNKIQTPNLDKLAANGTLFTQYYQASAVCSPSRTGLMSGRYPATQKIHTAIEINPQGNAAKGCADFLDPQLPTVTRLLQQNGYVTGHFGKWHLGATKNAPTPGEYGITTERTGNSNTPNKIPKNDRSISSKVIVDEVIKFVEDNKAKPFYVNTWFFDVHAVLEPSKEQLDAVKNLGIYDKVPFYSPAQIYYGTLREMDIQVGRLMDKLKELNLLDNTIIVFSSDNGPEDIDVINASHSGVGSTGMFRGRKRSLYEGGIRVPFIVQYPGKVAAGKVDNDNVIGGVDFLPTVCALANVKIPAGAVLDGEDRSEVITGKVKPRTRPLYWEWRYGIPGHLMNKSPTLAIRDGNWMFLVNHDGTRKELYDVPQDPMQMTNLVEKNSGIVKSLEAKLINWQKTLPPTGDMKNFGRIDYPWPGKPKKATAEDMPND